MTTLDALTEPLVRLFLRIDAASPADETLRKISEFWHAMRESHVAPGETDLAALPSELWDHAFIAHRSRNGTRHWLVSMPGSFVSKLLAVHHGLAINEADKRPAVRMRRLFDLVAERGEPFSAMFESKSNEREALLIEIFAAPLRGAGRTVDKLLIAAKGRVEQR